MTLGLGHKSLRECQRWITSSEFAFWQAWEQEYGPIGPAHDDELAAMISRYVRTLASGNDTPPIEAYLPVWTTAPAETPDVTYARLKEAFGD